MHTSYNFTDAQKLLIKPFERLSFVIVFILVTGLSQVVAYFVCTQPKFYILWEQSQIQYGIAAGIVAGVFCGASQWLILRKYILDWKWILVVGLSTTLSTVIQTTSKMWAESFNPSSLSSTNNGSFGQQTSPLAFAIVMGFLSIASIFISGYLEWYILRPYVTKARWWILIPLISVLAVVFLRIPEFLTLVFPRFSMDVISLTMLPTTQAIGFCLLKKKSASEHPILQSSLALAPDIVGYQDVKRLEEILHKSISKIWKTNLSESIDKLIYLIGIDYSNVMTYELMNQVSADNVDQTPLPELASNASHIALENKGLKKLAKFQVMFVQPGSLQIASWRGISVLWIGIAVYSGIIGISFLYIWLKIDILPFGK
jgi:hypothetical protein